VLDVSPGRGTHVSRDQSSRVYYGSADTETGIIEEGVDDG